ncbi:Hypothetical predicted protein [Octopus vulgaris]|uniref:ISXO2-like transposase domain-containing protein n=1 Tax=Octopus vulgaris TaxID=6645 RepID=A0AA36BQ98_OCTVU|nr:Hypothetical predicted protein [Octopus vulgaris]
MSCATCQRIYYDCIYDFHKQNEESIVFLRNHGVLPTDVICPRCRSECVYIKEEHLWQCRSYTDAESRKRQQCDYSVSDFKGSFLDNARIPPWKVVLFVNEFLNQTWSDMILMAKQEMCLRAQEWRSFCCGVTENWLHKQEQIGGESIEVEIGEALIVHRKPDRGPILNQVWLFGGLERTSKRHFVVPLIDKERDKATLVPLIQTFIKPGSVIYSDTGAAYSDLSSLGYHHYVINHSENSDQTHIHTQNIEHLWRKIKWSMRRLSSTGSKCFHQYLARYLFISSEKDKSVLHHKFFREAAQLYVPLSDQPCPSTT